MECLSRPAELSLFPNLNVAYFLCAYTAAFTLQPLLLGSSACFFVCKTERIMHACSASAMQLGRRMSSGCRVHNKNVLLWKHNSFKVVENQLKLESWSGYRGETDTILSRHKYYNRLFSKYQFNLLSNNLVLRH